MLDAMADRLTPHKDLWSVIRGALGPACSPEHELLQSSLLHFILSHLSNCLWPEFHMNWAWTVLLKVRERFHKENFRHSVQWLLADKERHSKTWTWILGLTWPPSGQAVQAPSGATRSLGGPSPWPGLCFTRCPSLDQFWLVLITADH